MPPHPELFGTTQFSQLVEPLGGILVMTTNFSAIRGEPGPTSPLGWMRDALSNLRADEPAHAAKLMATLPMLGWDFALPDGPAVPVDARAYLELLRSHRPERFGWHAAAAEHVFSYTDADSAREHSVYYPSLKGLAERLGMLRRYQKSPHLRPSHHLTCLNSSLSASASVSPSGSSARASITSLTCYRLDRLTVCFSLRFTA